MGTQTRVGKVSLVHDSQEFTCAWRLTEDRILTVIVRSRSSFAKTHITGISPTADLSRLAGEVAARLLSGQEPLPPEHVALAAPPQDDSAGDPPPDLVGATRPLPEPSSQATSLRRLRQVEGHLSTGERLIAEHRSRLSHWRGKGRNTSESERLLARLEEAYALHIVTRDRLRRETDAASEAAALQIHAG